MFRFSIRELMLVTLAVGLAVCWAIDRHRLSVENKRLINPYAALVEGNPPDTGAQFGTTQIVEGPMPPSYITMPP